jgi:hypothetical protein
MNCLLVRSKNVPRAAGDILTCSKIIHTKCLFCGGGKELDISRVLFSGISRSQPQKAVIYLGWLSPTTSSGFLSRNREKTNLCSLPCFPPGFTEPAPLDAAGALLPHLCTLTPLQLTVISYQVFTVHCSLFIDN